MPGLLSVALPLRAKVPHPQTSRLWGYPGSTVPRPGLSPRDANVLISAKEVRLRPAVQRNLGHCRPLCERGCGRIGRPTARSATARSPYNLLVPLSGPAVTAPSRSRRDGCRPLGVLAGAAVGGRQQHGSRGHGSTDTKSIQEFPASTALRRKAAPSPTSPPRSDASRRPLGHSVVRPGAWRADRRDE